MNVDDGSARLRGFNAAIRDLFRGYRDFGGFVSGESATSYGTGNKHARVFLFGNESFSKVQIRLLSVQQPNLPLRERHLNAMLF